QHPATNQPMTLTAPVDFESNHRLDLRSALISLEETNTFRLLHGASDGWPGVFVDRFGEFLLVQTDERSGSGRARGSKETCVTPPWRTQAEALRERWGLRASYHKSLDRHVRAAKASEASPQLLEGTAAPERFEILENGVRFGTSFAAGYSVGLF